MAPVPSSPAADGSGAGGGALISTGGNFIVSVERTASDTSATPRYVLGSTGTGIGPGGFPIGAPYTRPGYIGGPCPGTGTPGTGSGPGM